MEIETTVFLNKKKKNKKKETRQLMASFLFKLVFWSLARLGGGCRGRFWTFTLEVLLGRYRESCQKNLHIVEDLFFLEWVLRGNWRLDGIMGHFLGHLNWLLSNLKQLCLLGRAFD